MTRGRLSPEGWSKRTLPARWCEATATPAGLRQRPGAYHRTPFAHTNRRSATADSELTLGRENADVVLEDAEISRRHASVRSAAGTLEITDAGSANGTFVNGSRVVGSQQLNAGDVIRLGKTMLTVELPRTIAETVVAGVPRTVVTPPPNPPAGQ